MIQTVNTPTRNYTSSLRRCPAPGLKPRPAQDGYAGSVGKPKPQAPEPPAPESPSTGHALSGWKLGLYAGLTLVGQAASLGLTQAPTQMVQIQKTAQQAMQPLEVMRAHLKSTAEALRAQAFSSGANLSALHFQEPSNEVAKDPGSQPTVQHAPATLELMRMADHNPELKALLIESIEQARIKNPDRRTNPAQTLDEFYLFIDWASVCMPWNILQDQPAPKLYEQIDQSLDYFYFHIDQPLPELEGKGLYNNTLQYYEPFRSWLVGFTQTWGSALSTPGTWNQDYYAKAYGDKRFGLQEGWYEDPSHWKTFNDFFSRQLASPDQRPIAQPQDPSVVVGPADSVPQGVWDIDANSNLVDQNGAVVKSSAVHSIKDLLKGSKYQDAFANGVLTHTFLDVHDYHRYHFPVGGTIKEVNIIPQDDAVGGHISWSPEKHKYMLDSATPGWQFIETRGYVIIETQEYGLVAAMPVGMSQISSVNFEPNVKVGATFKKGDMLGSFLFGGSDYVIIFQKEAGFKLTAPTNAEGYQHILMGEAIGTLTGHKQPDKADAPAPPAESLTPTGQGLIANPEIGSRR